MQVPTNETASSQVRAIPRRVKVLVAVHLIIGIAPVATFSIPPTVFMLPLMWALAAVSLAQLMLLSFWVGMAPNTGRERLLGGLFGTAYVTTWPVVAQLSIPYDTGQGPSLATSFLIMFCSYYAMVVFFAGAFMLIRRRGTTLRRLSPSEAQLAPARVRYSVANLLVITSIAALVLSLMHNARPSSAANTASSNWQFMAATGLALIVFLVNTLCAAWAALSLGNITLRVAMAFAVAWLLGLAFSLTAGHGEMPWWMLLAGSLVTVVSTAIVVGSLLVVRSCGYRLVPQTPATADC